MDPDVKKKNLNSNSDSVASFFGYYTFSPWDLAFLRLYCDVYIVFLYFLTTRNVDADIIVWHSDCAGSVLEATFS